MRITANWTIKEDEFEFDGFSDKQLEQYRVAVYDRWNWETGSDEDWKLVERIEAEQKRRKALKFEDEMTKALAKDIMSEIDQEVLADLKKLKEEV